jgi:predicted ATPase with chaperone activity
MSTFETSLPSTPNPGSLADANPPVTFVTSSDRAAAAAEPGSDDGFLPRRPTTLSEAGLAENDVYPLILKFLYIRGSQAGRHIADQISLPFSIMEKLLNELRAQQLIGYRGSAIGGDYQWELAPKGIEQARQHLERCTYFGAAPVGLDNYLESITRQSIRNLRFNIRDVSRALADLTLTPMLVSQVGQALSSGRSLFLFGSPGNGKTSIARRILRAAEDAVWIPRTITVGGEIIRIFDPSVHEPAPLPTHEGVTRNLETDDRWIRIHRPVIVVGGELNLKQLEATLNPITGIIEAPTHVKSNCGCLVVDDFGRQRISVAELLNRWIVPLECGRDYLNLPSGRQVTLPFEQLVVFSTNLQPSQLCDEAFLRRISYKVQVPDPTEAQFRKLFVQRAEFYGLALENQWVEYLISEHYRKTTRPMRFCHVDDLLRHIREFCEFHERPLSIDRESIEVAVTNYFSVI